eukprot:7790683-Pyramimonas_sp.AAC.1
MLVCPETFTAAEGLHPVLQVALAGNSLNLAPNLPKSPSGAKTPAGLPAASGTSKPLQGVH